MAIESMKTTYSDAEVLMVLRKMVKASSVRKAGSVLGISGAYVHDVLKRRRALSENLAEALGFDLVPPPPEAKRRWQSRKERAA
jgi:hypothetical protein